MPNNTVIVGRIISIYNISEREMLLDVEVKNTNENVVVSCLIVGNMVSYIKDYTLRIGDMVGIKGMLSNFQGQLVLKAEKLTFLSSRKDTKGGEE